MSNTMKQNTSLQQFQNGHDLILRLCSRIGEGHNRKVSTQRIRNYVDWFETYYLNPHFEIEREQIFPLLGMNARARRALANHRRINRLLSCGCEDLKVLSL